MAQGLNNHGLVVGATGYASGVGAVYAFNKLEDGSTINGATYAQQSIITPSSPDTSVSHLTGFGFSADAGNTQWAIVGAPESEFRQRLCNCNT